VLAQGGDGTYNEVARGLLGSATAMGVLPGGSTSVLAYELAVPRPEAKALVSLLRGADRPMRVGHSDHDDVVLLMLSAGVDALVVEEAFRRRRRNTGKIGIAVKWRGRWRAGDLCHGFGCGRRAGDRWGWVIVGTRAATVARSGDARGESVRARLRGRGADRRRSSRRRPASRSRSLSAATSNAPTWCGNTAGG
jgi:hypothetical protein